jgi:hypothetical protein
VVEIVFPEFSEAATIGARFARARIRTRAGVREVLLRSLILDGRVTLSVFGLRLGSWK